jgi:hypothetical protein
MIWAVQRYDGKRWITGSLLPTRESARKNLKWARNSFPDVRFRLWPYVPRANARSVRTSDAAAIAIQRAILP